MKFKLRKNGNSWSVLLPKKIAEPYIASGEIELFFTQELVTSGYAATGEPVMLESVTTTTGDIPMTKEEKIEAARKLIEMTGNKQIEEEEPEVAPIDPDELVLAEDETPEEYVKKPGY